MTGILHIVLARKPLEGTVAGNCQKHGTGAINVEACRIGYTKRIPGSVSHRNKGAQKNWGFGIKKETDSGANPNIGRWPANVTIQNTDDILKQFPETSSGAMTHEVDSYEGRSNTDFLRGKSGPSNQHGDSGSASRFFFTFEDQQ